MSCLGPLIWSSRFSSFSLSEYACLITESFVTNHVNMFRSLVLLWQKLLLVRVLFNV